MFEIASIIKLILSNTKPETINSGEHKGKASKAKYTIEAQSQAEAQSKIEDLLKRYPVYPQLDLKVLQQFFA